MAASPAKPLFSSGIESLDEILQGILAGDNVVWQVDDIDHQIPFVQAFCRCAHLDGKKLVYFRFASHKALVPDKFDPDVFDLDPRAGFEQFITKILNVISEYGRGTCYVFDCLSGLAVDWYSDRMLGNFFKLACPYLYHADTVAYFALLRNSHTPLSVQAIHRTAQVVLDLYYSKGKYYLLPLKVLKRHTSTMYMLHSMDGQDMNPVTTSVVVSEILSTAPQPWIDCKIVLRDTWSRTLSEAQACCGPEGHCEDAGKSSACLRKLIRMIVTRNDKVAKLGEKYFDLADLISIGKRMVGTGLIGGKATGMLLARAILVKTGAKWKKLLETHDSFFIGSDIFYSFVINNKCWWERHQMKSSPEPFTAAEKIRQRLLKGKFQRDTLEQFREVLNYFGQSPIIVRSSSLLEDAYGNAFSGKYESVFLANQGTPEERLDKFKDAVRTVYASTMSREVLSYRAHRGLWSRYEEMALLVQRVSGTFYYSGVYLPHLAGVGYSFNPFVWNEGIDPHAGVLRLVFGLGTRAVDRHDDDYTRVVALNAPLKRPEITIDEMHKYSQHIVDIIDIKGNRQVSAPFEEVVKATPSLPLALFADRDREMEDRAEKYKVENVFSWMLTFKKVLADTPLIADMRSMLATLDRAYEYPVDIEFAVNFIERGQYRINLLQCRPFQVQMPQAAARLPKNIRKQDILLQTAGPIIGEAAAMSIDRIIYVRPEKYNGLSTSERFALARLIGDIANDAAGAGNTMLVGPGRWGSKMPELGVPVTFSDVRNVSVLCELSAMHAKLTPDLSLGTHFFNDIVEMGIVYLGIHSKREKDGYLFNEKLLLRMPNTLSATLREQDRLAGVIHLVEMNPGKTELFLHTNIMEQKGIVFRTQP